MYRIKVLSQFSGAHNLRGYKGKCEDLHGHNWNVEVSVSSEKLDDLGMVMDFKELKALLKEVISGLDHKHLNDLDFFSEINPTSENIAKHIYESLTAKNPGLKGMEVTVWETDSSAATYSQE